MTQVQKYFLHSDDDLKEALIALERAILTGARQVTFLGDTVIYNSQADMRKTRDELTEVLCERGVLENAPQKKRTKRARVRTTSTGF